MGGIFVSDSSITVKSIFRKYKVFFEEDYNSLTEQLFEEINYHVIIDNKVYELHQDNLEWVKNAVSIIGIDAIEKNKNFNTVKKIAEELLKNKINKNDKIIVIGGGIIQDVAAFTANIIKRGVGWYFFPTTLLAMCDSCIGSKVGINMSGYKNQLGIFCPPEKIFINLDYLSTLEGNDILSGLGEIIKVHLISGDNDYSNLESKYDKTITDYNYLRPFIYQSLTIKKKIVEFDEFDEKYRHILNYGHTFGHAIEAYTNNKIPHGIAVTIGMDIANYISLNKKYISKNVFNRVSNTLRKNIPYESLDFRNRSKMMKFMKGDKKYDGSNLNVILCKGIGNIFVDKIEVDKTLFDLIDEYTANYV
jgi:3-dehydroquinate synthase